MVVSTLAGAQKLQQLSFGTHPVGFQSNLEIDEARPSRQGKNMGRAVQVNIWYPIKAAKGNRLTLIDYISLVGKEDSIPGNGNEKESMDDFLEFPKSQGANMDAWNGFLNQKRPMQAIPGGVVLDKKMPIVLLVHGSAVQYAWMGEYLASHGMIAINVPYKGYLQNTFDVNVLGMETEMRDMEFALGATVKKLGLRPTQIGIVGMSFGGQSAVGIAVRNPLVKGIVSLDGGIGSSFGPMLLNGHPFFAIEKVNMPIIHLYNPADTGGNIDWFDVCQYADRYLVPFKNMDHSFFGIFGALDREIPHVLGPSRPRPGFNDEAVLLFTLTFLEQVFSTMPQEGKVTGLPQKHPWLSDCIEPINFRKKAFAPIPLDELLRVLESRGITGLMETHRRQKEITTMPITDGAYRSLFVDQFSRQDKTASMRIAEMYESDFPASALARYYHGRALQLNDRQDEAFVYFKNCLAMIAADDTMTETDKDAVKSRIAGFLK